MGSTGMRDAIAEMADGASVEEVCHRHGLNAEETATLRSLRIGATGGGPVRLRERLSRSAIAFGGGLGLSTDPPGGGGGDGPDPGDDSDSDEGAGSDVESGSDESSGTQNRSRSGGEDGPDSRGSSDERASGTRASGGKQHPAGESATRGGSRPEKPADGSAPKAVPGGAPEPRTGSRAGSSRLGGTHTLPGGTHTLPGGTHTLPGGTHTLPGGTHTLPGGTPLPAPDAEGAQPRPEGGPRRSSAADGSGSDPALIPGEVDEERKAAEPEVAPAADRAGGTTVDRRTLLPGGTPEPISPASPIPPLRPVPTGPPLTASTDEMSGTRYETFTTPEGEVRRSTTRGGDVTVTYPDGTYFFTASNGSRSVHYPGGSTAGLAEDGSLKTFRRADGSGFSVQPDRSVTTEHVLPDGRLRTVVHDRDGRQLSEQFSPPAPRAGLDAELPARSGSDIVDVSTVKGTVTTTYRDGMRVVSSLNEGDRTVETLYADGSRTLVNTRGSVTTRPNPDGTFRLVTRGPDGQVSGEIDSRTADGSQPIDPLDRTRPPILKELPSVPNGAPTSVVTNADRSITRSYAGGVSVTSSPGGRVVADYGNGVKVETLPGAIVAHTRADRSVALVHTGLGTSRIGTPKGDGTYSVVTLDRDSKPVGEAFVGTLDAAKGAFVPVPESGGAGVRPGGGGVQPGTGGVRPQTRGGGTETGEVRRTGRPPVGTGRPTGSRSISGGVVVRTYETGAVTQTRPNGVVLVRQPGGGSAVVTPIPGSDQVSVVERDPAGEVVAQYDSSVDEDGWPVPPPVEEGPPVSLLAGGGAAVLALGAGAAAMAARKRGRSG